MRISKISLATFALLLACTATVSGLTSEDAIGMANEAEAMLPVMLAEKNALMSTAQPTESTETIDGITYSTVQYTDPITGKTLKQMYNSDGNLVKEDYYDPEILITLTTEYDVNGNVNSESFMTINEDGTASKSSKIVYNEDGTKTYTAIDYTQGSNNKVTTEVKAGGDINNPDDIISMTVETQPGMPRPPTVVTCPNTGQSEVDVV